MQASRPKTAWRSSFAFLPLLLWSTASFAQEVQGPEPTTVHVFAEKAPPVDIDMPAPPRGILEQLSKHGLPPIPAGAGGLAQPHNAPSDEAMMVPLGPGAFKYFINRPSKPSGGSSSTTTEPTGAINRDTVLQTGNWYASLSKDNGMTWTHISPYTKFPSADGGFCCDQKAIYVGGAHDVTVWLLQYSYSGTTGAGRHRLAFTNGRDDLRNNAGWSWYDITPQLFGLGNGLWYDFPDVSHSDTHIYFSTNVYNGATGNYVTSVLYRAELADFANGGGTSFNFYTRATIGGHSYRFSQGPEPLMYAASHINTTTLRIYWWAAAGGISWADRAVPAWSGSQMSMIGPDGRDWAGFGPANDRVLGGYANNTEFGFLWASDTVAGRPQPFTRVARFRVSDRALIDTQDIWSASTAFIYPAASTNSLGHVGVTCAVGSASSYPHTSAMIVDGYAPNFFGQTFHASASGTSGPSSNRWGDYFTVARHPINASTFIASGKEQNGGATGASASPRHMWFGREDYTPSWVDLDVTSTPVSGISITVDETDHTGLKNGVTPFTRSYAPRQGYTLRAPATFVSGPNTYQFHQWVSNGSLRTIDEEVLTVADIFSATDTAEARYRLRRTLTVNSTNPAAGVSITVGLNDINGANNGVTAFARIYKDTAVVPLTAPAFAGANPFKRWRLNGVNQPLGQALVNVTMSANVTAIADYFVHTSGSFTPFGVGCAGSNGIDVQSASGLPEIGKIANYSLAGGRPLSTAILVLGFSKTNWSGIPLPLPMPMHAPGCSIYNDLVVTFAAATNGAGNASIPVGVANDASLINAHYYTQYWCVDLLANSLNLTFSNGMDTKIGGDI